jgi:uncharacterized glyoxalase superfamily protein PhnB
VPLDIHGIAPLLQVFDMPTSVRFYRDYLGFELVSSSHSADHDQAGWVRLRLNGANLMLNTAYERAKRPPVPDPARLAAHRDTTLYFDCSDLDSAFQQLEAVGVDVEPPFALSYGMRQLYLRDPDCYGLCFQHEVSIPPTN